MDKPATRRKIPSYPLTNFADVSAIRSAIPDSERFCIAIHLPETFYLDFEQDLSSYSDKSRILLSPETIPEANS